MEQEIIQLTYEELRIITNCAIIQLYDEQRRYNIDNSHWIKLCDKIYRLPKENGALFFDIVPDYAVTPV